MSFMQPRTLRSAVFATVTAAAPRSPNVSAGRPSRASSRAISPVTVLVVSRRPAARTSGSKTVNNVAAWVSSRHLRPSNHSRLPYQSSGSGASAASPAGLMTSSSLFVHRRITSRCYFAPGYCHASGGHCARLVHRKSRVKGI